ncbi:hypothetical protein [Streptomyces alboflavus]|uniref:hypothetical protein n=1 Tax=Streptomyces alboflavus TaxID=67267 RepID=UPI00368A7D9A
MRVTIDQAGMAAFLGPGGPIWQEVEQRTERVYDAAQTLTPRGETGRTRGSLYQHVSERGRYRIVGTVGSPSEIMVYLERGTGLYGPNPGWITSRTPGKMMGPIRGPYPPFLRRHRGMRPRRPLSRALRVQDWAVTELGW